MYLTIQIHFDHLVYRRWHKPGAQLVLGANMINDQEQTKIVKEHGQTNMFKGHGQTNMVIGQGLWSLSNKHG